MILPAMSFHKVTLLGTTISDSPVNTGCGPTCLVWKFSTCSSFLYTVFSEIFQSFTACLKGWKDSKSQKTCKQSLQHQPHHSSKWSRVTHKGSDREHGIPVLLATLVLCCRLSPGPWLCFPTLEEMFPWLLESHHLPRWLCQLSSWQQALFYIASLSSPGLWSAAKSHCFNRL